ncbi:MAG: aldolase [Planctomycetaceae bacterium]|nr:aldolase [Planctomycetaceae bacterium]
MRRSRVLDNIQQGLPSFGVALHLASASMYEMTSLLGFDAIWVDMEHHGLSLEHAEQLFRASRVGDIDIVARPAKGEFMRMSRLLEIGATGIMYPRCNSAEEAAEVVKWAKFPPMGQRGCDAAGPDASYQLTPLNDYLKQANERTFVIIQIEEAEAVDRAEEIAAVPGVDMLMLGPGDFSILSGVPGQFDHPKVVDALERVAAAATKAGKHWAATCGSPEIIQKMADRGGSLMFHGCDQAFVKQGLESVRGQIEKNTGRKFNTANNSSLSEGE